MNWRWLLGDFIPPEIPLSWKERRELGRRAAQAAPWSRKLACISIFLFVVAIAIGSGAVVYAQNSFPMFCVIILGCLGLPIVEYLSRQRRWPCIKRELLKHGFVVCDKCGYWLRELPDDIDKCPECGAEREPISPEAAASKPSPPRGEGLGEGRNDD